MWRLLSALIVVTTVWNAAATINISSTLEISSFFLALEIDNRNKCQITINTVYLLECQQIMFTFDLDTWDLLREQKNKSEEEWE